MTIPATVLQTSEIPKGLINNPAFKISFSRYQCLSSDYLGIYTSHSFAAYSTSP